MTNVMRSGTLVTWLEEPSTQTDNTMNQNFFKCANIKRSSHRAQYAHFTLIIIGGKIVG
jgi:hypothetical protein